MIALAPQSGVLHSVAFVDHGERRRIISLRRANRREAVDKVRLLRDVVGKPLTVWLGDPNAEHICEATADQIVLIEDATGRVIGIKTLHFQSTGAALTVETFVTPDA